MNPYDFSKFDISLYPALKAVALGRKHMHTEAVPLMRRGLVEMDGLYRIKLTGRGKWALGLVFLDTEVVVRDSYHLPQMHGRKGLVVGLRNGSVINHGFDEYGVRRLRASPQTYVDVVFPDEPWSTWCFYTYGDLGGLADRTVFNTGII